MSNRPFDAGDEPIQIDRTAEVPGGSGIGVEMDLDYIESCTETVEEMEQKS